MSNTDRIIVVTGAAGQQGGAVARHLLAKGWTIRALTRDPNKPAARALVAAGAEIVQADNEDRASLDAAFKGAYGVFSVQNFWLPNVGAEGEVRQGKQVADAAQAAGVRHFVYSSVGAAHRGMGQAHFATKWEIEQYVQSVDLPYTIVRPVAFMDNYNWQRAGITNGIFTGWGLRPDKGLQLIAAEDIGVFVALAFENPQDYLGRTIELAGEELTEPQIADTLSKVIGRPVALQPPSMPEGARPRRNSSPCFSSSTARATTRTSVRCAESTPACSPSSSICARTAGKTPSRCPCRPAARHGARISITT